MLATGESLIPIAAIVWMSIVTGNFELIEGPVDTEVKIGDTTYLNCSLSNQNADVSWFHHSVGKGPNDYKSVYIKRKVLYPYNIRFRIEKVESNGSFNFNLVVINAELSDAGKYVCQNGGTESPVPVELIVIESNPVCTTNSNTIGLIGPNSCGLNKDVVHLSCAINYAGNIPPEVQWTMDQNGTLYEVPKSQTTCKASNGRVVCNYAAESVIEMDGSVFLCQTTRSRYAQYNCKTDVFKIYYAFHEKKPTKKTVGDNVTCSANTNLADCNYTWIWSDGESEETLSENEILTITKPGWHQCQSNCYINRHQCNFEAMTILANTTCESYSNTDIRNLLATILSSGIIITVCISIVMFFRWKIFKDIDLFLRSRGVQDALLPEHKGLLIMNNGVSVDPKPIEEAVKRELPFVSNCMLVGHEREFLSILLTIKVEKNPITFEPSDKLSPEVIKWIQVIGGNVTTISEILETKCPPVFKAIQKGIDSVNEQAISHDHDIKNWTILPKDFSEQGGEINITVTLARPRIEEMYSSIIDSIYGITQM